MNKITILKSAFGEARRSKDELLFYCPFCKHHKQKFSINTDTDKYKCWVCDIRGANIRRVLKKYVTISVLFEWDKITGRLNIGELESMFELQAKHAETMVDLPNEFFSLANKNLPKTALSAIKYLQDRGLSRKDVLKWKIGYCSSGPFEGRVVVPSFNAQGFCNYYIARSTTDAWPKYMNPEASKDICFNELYLDWDKDVTLVEGVFDAVKCDNAIPLLGSTLSPDSLLFKKIVFNDPTLYIALDPDAEKKARRVIDKFIEYDMEIYKIDVSGYADVGEMTKEEFLRRKESATLINDDWLLESQLLAV
jgi:DNA primase